MIQVTCACGATMQVQDENAGKQCKCPKCGAICQIPAAPVAAAPAPAAPVEAAPAPAPAAPAPEAAPPAEAAPAAAPVAGKRPGGLTALAVLNFVWGGFGIIGGLWNLIAGAAVQSTGEWMDNIRRNSGAPEGVNQIVTQVKAASGSFYFLGIMGLILAAFLIVAGVGYIKQSRKNGYVFGNIYGIAGIILAILSMFMLPWVFGFGAIFGLIYPIVTLALLNTVFKESFPNP